MKNDEERAGHSSEREEALCEIRDALFDDVGGVGREMAFGVVVFVRVGDHGCYAERGRMEGCLWDEAVGKGNSEESRNAGCQA